MSEFKSGFKRAYQITQLGTNLHIGPAAFDAGTEEKDEEEKDESVNVGA